MKKKCPACGQVKILDEFNKNKKRSDGLQTYCKQCQSKYDKRYYSCVNKTRRKANVKARKKVIRDWYVSYKKAQLCTECGNDDFRVLEFHHCNGRKDFNISDAVGRGYGLETLQLEIKKCKCLCANCHRILTYTEQAI